MPNPPENLTGRQGQAPQEFIARSVVDRFPQSAIRHRDIKSDLLIEIYFQEKLLIILDKKGIRYFFPTRFKRILKWEKITTTGEKRVIEYILRDLAEANYLVLSSNNKQLLKKPIHISRYKRCPGCSQQGCITMFTPDQPTADLDGAIGAEIICSSCGWLGVRGELLRKSYFPRPRKG